jgi:hypothetical protein
MHKYSRHKKVMLNNCNFENMVIRPLLQYANDVSVCYVPDNLNGFDHA